MNKVIIIGRFVRDPELRTLQDNTSVCTGTVAVDKWNRDKGADFFPVVFWKKTAEFVTRYFAKGSKIAIYGRLQTREYTDRDGNKRTITEIVGEEVEFAGEKKDSYGQQDNRTTVQAPQDADISLPFDLDP